MTAPIIQAEYDELEALARRFDEQSSISGQLAQLLQRDVDGLVNGGWQGRGIDAFSAEMTNEIFPALFRLSQALAQSGAATRAIIEILRTAEAEAAALIQGDGASVHDNGSDSAASAGNNGGGEGGGDGRGGANNDGFFTDFPTLGKGLTALYDLLEPHIGQLREIPGPVGALLGTIFDAWGNPDGDWVQSFASAAIENFGLYAIGLGYPPVAVAQAISDVTQLANDISAAVDRQLIDIVAANPQIAESLQGISDDFHNNIELLDLSNITGPLADAIYDVQLAPIVDAGRNLWDDPSLANAGNLGINLLGLPYGIPVGTIRNPQHFRDALPDLGDAGLGVIDFGIGAAQLPQTNLTRILGLGTAGSIHVVDSLPIPDGWKDTFEDGAGFVTDALDRVPVIGSVSGLFD